MAYNVSANYREKVYSGESMYDCRLYINNQRVPVEQLSYIKISSPIIDTTNETGKIFHIGTFASQKLEIQFKNLDGLTLDNNPNIELQIGLYVDNDYEYVPIGKYLIDDLGENYQKTCKITCLDYAMKFRSTLDISKLFTHTETNNANETVSYAYASELFEAICLYFGVQVGTYPNVNNNKKIYFYDSTLTGKQYIMFLAELFGGNAKIERDGSCSIIPLNNVTNIEIDALSSKKFEVGDTYTLSRVCYDNGSLKYQAGGNVITVDTLPSTDIDVNSYYYLTTDRKYYVYLNSEWTESQNIKNTLYIRNDNLFITQQTDIDNIYNAIQGFTVTNITCENRIDLSLDSWDIIKFTVGEQEYYTFYDNSLRFNGTTMGKVEVKIPLKAVEETTNILGSTEAKIRKIRSEVDEQNAIISTTVEQVDEQGQTISRVEQTVDEINRKISDIADITTSQETITGRLEFTDINESEPITVNIHPISENISYLYPFNLLYPANDLYIKIRTLRFTNTTTEEVFDYELDDDLLYYNETNYDELTLDYDSQKVYISKKCKYNTSTGAVELLATARIDEYTFPNIPLTAGDYTVEMLKYDNTVYVCYLKCRLMAQNIYTTQFATKVEMNTKIQQTTTDINASVDQKLTNYSTTTQMNSAINLSAQGIENRVSATYETKVDANSKKQALETKISQTASTIELAATDNSTSAGITIKLKNADGTELDSKSANITMSGLVKFTDLSTSGSTTINGANITTGTISANRVDLSGYLTVTSARNTYATKSGLQNGTTTINGGCLTTGTINASLCNITNISASNITTGTLNLTGNNTSITSTNFSVDSNGNINAKGGKIGGFGISGDNISASKGNYTVTIANISNSASDFLVVRSGTEGNYQFPFYVRGNGFLHAENAEISGNITASTLNGNTITGGTVSGTTMSNSSYTASGVSFSPSSSRISGFTTYSNQMVISNNYGSMGMGLSSFDGNYTNNIFVESSNGDNWVTIRSTGGYTNGVWQQTSLEKYKKNFEKLDNKKALEIVLNTDIYKYNLKSENDKQKKHLGFVIGEKYNYADEIVAEDEKGEAFGVDTYTMTSASYGAIQELYRQIQELKEKVG